MERTAILYGPGGIGKTAFSEQIRELLKCTGILDPWDGKTVPALPGLLLIANLQRLPGIVPAPAERTFQVPTTRSLELLLEDLRYQAVLASAIEGRA